MALNGATTSTTSSTTSTAVSSPPSQQQHSPPAQSPIQTQQSKQPSLPSSQLQQALMIDPSLTTLNGGTRTTSNHQHYPNANYTAQPSTVQPQQTSSLAPQQFSYTHLLQPSLASYRPPPSYYQSQQHQQSPQGTLSPQALHSSSGSMMSTLIPSSFYAPSSSSLIPPSSQSHLPSQPAPQPSIPQQTHSRPQDPPPPPQKTPQELKNEFLIRLRPQLQTNAFTGAGAVNMLVEILTDYGITDVDAQVRLETLTKMRDGAGNHYFRAWSENTSAMTITREWLKAAQAADAESPLAETIMPLLHIIDRLPLTLETLKASKLGKIIIKLVKEPRSPAIKDMAANVERKWRSLINNNAESSKTTDEDSKSKNLKRKLNETSSRTAPPPKKPAVGNTASASRTAVVKKEPPATSKPTAKDAKSDSSFFSAPKPKPKPPSFKKAPSASTTATFSKAPPPSNVAQPSSANPFEEALKSMGRTAKRDSPAVATPPSTSETPPQVQTNGLSRKGVKKKSVTWAPPSMLEQIKFIERAVYDDDPVDGNHTTHSLKDLDRGEGAALHAQVFEETLDWYDPICKQIPSWTKTIKESKQMMSPLLPSVIENPIVEDDRQPGSLSTEKTVQEKREQTALGALYMSPAHIPDSPAEPPHVISEEETDKSMVTMTSGPEVDAIFWNGPIMPVAQSVAELVGQLANGGGTDPSISGAHFNGQGLDLAAVGLDGSSTLAAVQALPQEQIQRTRGEQPLIIRTLDNSRFRIIIKTKMQVNGVQGDEGEDEDGGYGVREEEEITGLETVTEDHRALSFKREGERILQ
ncbi:hypothetical protein H0H93_011630, partial [Arthromyces matolae]